MLTVYLIRHTKPDVAKGICYGQSDVPLAASFPEESAKTRTNLFSMIGNAQFRVISSPLQRSLRLAQVLCDKEDVETDTRFKEMNFGAWEMQAWGEIDEFVMNAWMRDFVRVAPPNGETFEDLVRRSVEAFHDAVAAVPEGVEHLCIVAHAGVVRALLANTLEMPLAKAFSLEIDYGSIAAIRYDPQYSSVLFVNR
ncbi:MAG: alpha-ribazole phosphatase [Candidatus Kapabacteria bacterium]|jgi:alpha-ribazole phosphatase|nr:alpha-ribazole phosphatase [Candidatus Kapabacteria bacterium]